MGDRLAFSNGIIGLALLSSAILVGFGARTEALIPLYAIGVFLAFTLSQTGMIVHWWRNRNAHWRRSLAINGFGAVASAVVLITAAVAKFEEGAWLVVLGIPLVAALLLAVRRHYDRVRHLVGVSLPPDHVDPPSARSAPGEPFGSETAEAPADVAHLVVVPVSELDRSALRALSYARSLCVPMLALHVSPEQEEVDSFRQQWDAWGAHVPLEVVLSPYRATVAPTVHYLESLLAQRPDLTITVVVPYLAVPHLWQRVLHSRTGRRLRSALARHPGVVIAEVPFHLQG
jgi:hypothetical protein